MRLYIYFLKLGLFQREFLWNYLVYRAQIFRDNWNCHALSIFGNFTLLASSDNDKPMLMRQKCKQGFAYPICDALPSRSARHSSTPLQKPRRNDQSKVWTEEMVFAPAQELSGIVRTEPKALTKGLQTHDFLLTAIQFGFKWFLFLSLSLFAISFSFICFTHSFSYRLVRRATRM